MEDLLW